MLPNPLRKKRFLSFPDDDAGTLEASRTWLLRRCSYPHIFFWYLRIAGASLVTYLASRCALNSYRQGGRGNLLAVLAFAAYRILNRPCRSYENVPEDFELAFEKLSERRILGRFTTRDGVDIAWGKIGSGPKIVLLANGLGCSEVYWIQALQYFDSVGAASEYTVVTWDYRGLFRSGSLPDNRTAKFSVRDHAEDGLELLTHLGCDVCFTAVGWSTGVQVVLEMASISPERVERLVLLNGAHGHVLQTVLQPVFKVPGMGLMVHLLARFIINFGWLPLAISILRKCAPHIRMLVIRPVCLVINCGYEAFVYNYFLDLLNHGERHVANYIKLASCLDSHSSFNTLDEITQPTLVITGMLDIITPAFHSFLIASRMPNAKLVCYNMGSHFCGLEYPEELARVWHLFGKMPLENFWTGVKT